MVSVQGRATADPEFDIRNTVDAIDTGSYKLAVQTCNKLLKKHPDADLVKVGAV